MRISPTQAGLATLLHVHRRAVAGWEAGSSHPKVEHLKELIVLGVEQQAFAAGREAEEIHALWRAAHQKVLLDETWLHDLLAPPAPIHRQMFALFAEDTAEKFELTKEQWKNRPWYNKVSERILAPLRFMM